MGPAVHTSASRLACTPPLTAPLPQLLDTQATYHNTTLSMLQSLQPTWTAAQDKKPEELPPDTWTTYVQNPDARQPKCAIPPSNSNI